MRPRLSVPPTGKPFSSVCLPSKGSFPSKKLGSWFPSQMPVITIFVDLLTFGRMLYEVSSQLPYEILIESESSSVHV